MPDKAEYVWGEPIHYFTFIIKNTGEQTMTWIEGGDYRGGRSESHKISAVDAEVILDLEDGIVAGIFVGQFGQAVEAVVFALLDRAVGLVGRACRLAA